MGNRYWIRREAVTPTAGNDIFTVVSAASRRCRILEVHAGGVGASSAPQNLHVVRASTAGITPGGTITPAKGDHVDQPAAGFTVPTTWGTQPVIGASDHGIEMTWNALGGWAPWKAGSNKGVLEARNGENISFRIPTGPTPQAMNISALVEED